MSEFVNTGDQDFLFRYPTAGFVIWKAIPEDIAPTQHEFFMEDIVFEWELTGRCRDVFKFGIRTLHEEVEVRVRWIRTSGRLWWRKNEIMEANVWVPEFWFKSRPVITYSEPRKNCTLFGGK